MYLEWIYFNSGWNVFNVYYLLFFDKNYVDNVIYVSNSYLHTNRYIREPTNV